MAQRKFPVLWTPQGRARNFWAIAEDTDGWGIESHSLRHTFSDGRRCSRRMTGNTEIGLAQTCVRSIWSRPTCHSAASGSQYGVACCNPDHQQISNSQDVCNRDRGSGCPLSPPTPPGMRVRTGRFEKLRFTPCFLCEGAGVGLHCPELTRLHLAPPGPFRQCGHLMPFPTHRLPKNHSFSFGPSLTSAS